MSACRTCTFPIKFVRMRESGKAMPIDPVPDDTGNIACTPAGREYVDGHYLAAGEQLAQGEVRMMQHWYTCDDPSKPGRPRRRNPTPTQAEPQPALDI